MFTIQRLIVFTVSIVVLLGLNASSLGEEEHDHGIPEKLGAVYFPISCPTAATGQFERAVALLHSFAYSAAEKAFRELSEAAPDCAMAHWGVAMTYFHPLWEPHLTAEDAKRGLAEIEQAIRLGGSDGEKPREQPGISDREQAFITALAALYVNANSASYGDRVKAYTTAMSHLAQRYPNDVECQVFYALALLATASPTDKNHANEKKAVGLLEPLFQKYPQHPGIPHYLIHACDNAEMARRGLTAAQVYAEIAPSAPHALHMPSHIYTRLGMWERSIASNLAARQAAHEQGDVGEELHAMDYLTYAYLQIGGAEQAASVVKDLRAMSNLHGGEFKVGYAASAMPVRYAMERKQWAEAARLEPIAGAQPNVFAITVWARAVAQARSGNPAAARKELDDLKAAHQKLKATGDDYWATQIHVQLNEALAWIAQAERKNDEAVKLMREAADEEDSVEKRPVTPGAIVPAREQLGELLLELNRPQDALAEFKRSLEMSPNRRAAVMGRDRAQELVNTGGRTEND